MLNGGIWIVKKDLSEKALIRKNDVFADIINTILGNGSEIVKEEDLDNSETESIHFNDQNGELEDLFRDVCKKDVRNGRIYTIWGIESQQKIDYTMPLRCMGYDYNAYKQQEENLLERRRRRLEEVEEKSGIKQKGKKKGHFRKTDKLAPVVTLVLYWGQNWEKPRSLHDMIAIPEDMDQSEIQIPDYRMNVIELGKLDKDILIKFKSDFRFVAAHVRYRNSPEELEKFVRSEDGELEHSLETRKALAVITGDDRYMDANIEEREGIRMSILYDVLVEERAEKRAKEIAEKRVKEIAEKRAEEIAEKRAEEWAKKKTEEIVEKRMKEVAENLLSVMGDRKIAEITGMSVEAVGMLRTKSN